MGKRWILLISVLLGLNGVYAQQKISINDENGRVNFFLQEQNRSLLKNAGNEQEQSRLFDANPQLKNFSQRNEGDTLSLDFFAGKRYEAVVRRVTASYDGITGITAQILDTEAGYCFISISENNIALSAELPQKDEFFSIKKINAGTYLTEQKLSEVQHEAGGECNHVSETSSPDNTRNAMLRAVPSTLPESNAAVTVDMLIVYTPAAKAVAIRSGNDINTMIDQGIQRANLVLSNSQTNVTMNLVYKQEVDYTETTSLNTDLIRLRNPDDGYADEAHALRTRYNADLVVLLLGETSTSNVAGAGYIMGDEYSNPQSGFSVVKVSSIASAYTLIHEVGHNFGCGHHTLTDNTALYSYAHGYRGTSTQGNRFATVMTYETIGGERYPRIPYFSDPNIFYEGTAIGDANANNAKVIRQTKALIAAYSNEIPWTDAFLKNITTSAGILTPAFNPGIKQYRITVGNNVTTIDITGIANSPRATVYGNIANQPLAIGNNTVDLTVESGWGTEKTYRVTISRQQLPLPVVFPTAPMTTYNPVQTLSSIVLQNGSGDGMFAWSDPALVPVAENNGYEVIFTPNDTINFDYSNITLRRTVQLTVNKAAQTITFPVIPEKNLTDAPFNVNASVNTGLPLSYESSDTNVAEIASDGTVTIKDAGTTIILVRQRGNENYLEVVETQLLTVSQGTSLIDLTATEKNEYLYPNPVSRGEKLSIVTNAGISRNTIIDIYDLTGNRIQRIPITEQTSTIQAPSEPGIYLFILKTGNRKTRIEVIVK